MSDFDKEAERERLREKYEQDQQKREASERMSDLLLKGATMTNSHCGNCGDPIFRYDGEEFCPTCQQVVTNDEAVEEAAETDESVDAAIDADEGGADATSDPAGATGEAADADGGTASDENGDAPGHIEIKQPDGPAVRTGGNQGVESGADAGGDAGGDEPSSPSEGAAGTGAQPGESGSRRSQSGSSQSVPSQSGPSQSGPSQSVPSQPSGRSPSEAGGQPSNRGGPAADDGDDEFGAARASLVRTLRTQAERAEQCDDPRRARDHLAAAREAAEALSALSSSY